MTKITYVKTFFKPPSPISDDLYNMFEVQLSRHPNSQLNPNPESFIEHFGGSFTTITLCILISVICGLVIGPEKLAILGPLSGISAFVAIITFVYLIAESPSYAAYIKEKEVYFNRMKNSILNTTNYREFIGDFYGK